DEEDDGIRALVDHLIDLGVLLDRVQVRIHDGDLLAVTGKRRLLALHVEELSQHLDVDGGRDRDGLVGERRTRSGTSGHERTRARHLRDTAGENQATPGQAGRLEELLTAETLMLEWSFHLRRFLSLSRQTNDAEERHREVQLLNYPWNGSIRQAPFSLAHRRSKRIS